MSEAATRPTNRLSSQTSPYLLQHAHNPVDWYPWGAEALEKASAEEKPIFLSIGYAACHWCHVMERESFENEGTARLLNDSFVAIKVDREERPDLDAIYMDAVQQMTGHGGWPMSVFLTPDGKPFYGGTYFPDTARHGLPSFNDVLRGVAEAWRERRGEIESAGGSLARAVAGAQSVVPAPGADVATATEPQEWTLDAALVALERDFDSRNGGWGGAPKFPQPMTIEFLLRLHGRTGDARPLEMARRTLDAMAAGGIHDHLGGGFARYATDSVWLVPHFEKMLYDNALLARAYLHGWQVTSDARYRAVVEETLAFVLRELRTTDGGFAASLDADTHGEEGATYVWTKSEVDAVLGADAEAFESAYDVTENGNWEGRNILRRVANGDEQGLEAARSRLLAMRDRRPQPARDDKVLTAWNGLMIAAFADAGVSMNRTDWTQAAATAADLLLRDVRDDDRLKRSWKDGRALHNAVLEDYANLAEGLLALYQATFDERWFVAARELADVMLEHFSDPAGGFFDTADDHERLIARPKSLQDNAVPSGNAMATTVLLKLAAYTGESHYSGAAERAVAQVHAYAHRYPTAFAQWLSAITTSLAGITEVAISGDPTSEATGRLLAEVWSSFRPFAVLAVGRSDGTEIPLLRDRPMRDGKPTAYVCQNFACQAPTTDPVELTSQLAAPR
jgi:uncharacterized protein